MPSPVGHSIAGATIAWLLEPRGRSDARADSTRLAGFGPLTWWCAFLAAAADLDLLLPGTHRTFTHSVTAVAITCITTIVVMTVTGKVTAPAAWRVALACSAAYASHLLLDWMAVDDTPPRGIQMLWPFSREWFISNWDLFRGTARLGVFTAPAIRQNVLAVTQEILSLAPIAYVVWLVRVKPAAGLPTEVAGSHHPAE
ncbi:MAG TPA: metal-dependent hydrolase [Vicinamibacterales bacterium]|jgi:membrane-bound metal-dependent hydrolase YbcI (DUF457 family)